MPADSRRKKQLAIAPPSWPATPTLHAIVNNGPGRRCCRWCGVRHFILRGATGILVYGGWAVLVEHTHRQCGDGVKEGWMVRHHFAVRSHPRPLSRWLRRRRPTAGHWRRLDRSTAGRMAFPKVRLWWPPRVRAVTTVVTPPSRVHRCVRKQGRVRGLLRRVARREESSGPSLCMMFGCDTALIRCGTTYAHQCYHGGNNIAESGAPRGVRYYIILVLYLGTVVHIMHTLTLYA